MNIQPLGEQIIIKTIPVDVVSGIIIPDSAKRITVKSKGAPTEHTDALNFVEAEVIAVGPGKRLKDPRLFSDLVMALRSLRGRTFDARLPDPDISSLIERSENQNARIPPIVKPGDRILYHPAVTKFDRDITSAMANGENLNGSKYFMIREDSVLAVIERD